MFTFSMHCQNNFPSKKQNSDLDIGLSVGTEVSAHCYFCLFVWYATSGLQLYFAVSPMVVYCDEHVKRVICKIWLLAVGYI